MTLVVIAIGLCLYFELLTGTASMNSKRKDLQEISLHAWSYKCMPSARVDNYVGLRSAYLGSANSRPLCIVHCKKAKSSL